VVRDAATDDTAADDENSAFGWQLGIHWDGSLRAKHFFTMPRFGGTGFGKMFGIVWQSIC